MLLKTKIRMKCEQILMNLHKSFMIFLTNKYKVIMQIAQ